MLQGERVTLRPVRADDVEKSYAWRVELATWGDTTAVAPHPMTFEAYKKWHDETTLDEKSCTFAIDVDGTFIGRASLFAFDELARNAEVGLAIGPEHRGQGYGREVLALLLDFGFRHRNLHRIWLEASAANERAIRAYRAAGFVHEGTLREHAWIAGEYVDMVRMAVLRRDWEAAR